MELFKTKEFKEQVVRLRVVNTKELGVDVDGLKLGKVKEKIALINLEVVKVKEVFIKV